MMKKDIDAVLIDDDPLVYSMWEFSAINNDKCLKIFANPDDFFPLCFQISYHTPIYIDSNLGKGLKGEFVAKEIYDKGFTSLYLTTGMNQKEFITMPWIKAILGKAPPWECF